VCIEHVVDLRRGRVSFAKFYSVLHSEGSHLWTTATSSSSVVAGNGKKGGVLPLSKLRAKVPSSTLHCGLVKVGSGSWVSR
jgi:hypothetical protein